MAEFSAGGNVVEPNVIISSRDNKRKPDEDIVNDEKRHQKEILNVSNLTDNIMLAPTEQQPVDMDHEDPGSNTETDVDLFDQNISIHDQEARHVFIKCLSQANPKALFEINSFDKSDIIEGIIGDFPFQKTLASGKLLVEVNDADHLGKLLKIKSFGEIPVVAEIAYHIGTVQGVVQDPSICDMPIQTLLNKLKAQHVVNVRPIFKGPESTRTKYVILSFRLKKLPRSILFGRENKRVVPYRNNVTQCTKCWWFGHREVQCIRPKTCKACNIKGDSHDSEVCMADPSKPLNCSNCGGNHTADDKICPIWTKQLDIAKIRTQNNLSYNKALEVYNKKNLSQNNGNKALKKVINPNKDIASSSDYVALSPKNNYNYSEALKSPKIVRQPPPVSTDDEGGIWQIAGSKKTRRKQSTYVAPNKRHTQPLSSEDELIRYLDQGATRHPTSVEGASTSVGSLITHGKDQRLTHTLSQSDEDTSTGEILSQVLRRRKNINVPFRPQTIKKTKPIIPENLPTPIVEGSKEDSKDIGVQTQLIIKKLLKAIYRIFISFHKYLTAKDDDNNCDFNIEILTSIINVSLGIDLTSEIISNGLSG